MKDVSGTGLTLFEKALAELYVQQGFQKQAGAYLTLRPDVSYQTAERTAKKILERPHVQAYMQTLLESTPEELLSARKKLVHKVQRITQKAEDSAEFGHALKGCELEAKVEGLFQQDETEGEQYMQFFNNCSITVTQAKDALSNAKVIEHEGS